MHVLGKPIRRHLATVALGFCCVENFLADGGELRAHAEVVHEAGNLPVGVAPLIRPETRSASVGSDRQSMLRSVG